MSKDINDDKKEWIADKIRETFDPDSIKAKKAKHAQDVMKVFSDVFDMLDEDDSFFGVLTVCDKGGTLHRCALLNGNLDDSRVTATGATIAAGANFLPFTPRSQWFDACLESVFNLARVDLEFAQRFQQKAAQFFIGDYKLLEINEDGSDWKRLNGSWSEELLEKDLSGMTRDEIESLADEFKKSIGANE
jgi:hypothetical protein